MVCICTRQRRWIRPAALAMLGVAALIPPLGAGGEEAMGLTLTSSAFRAGDTIPMVHTCDGADRSPPLAWSGAPARAAGFALIVDDPDAPGGTWVHWVLYDLPAGTTGLAADVPKVERLPALGGAVQGRNDFRTLGWGGPCPPPGPAHHYVFKVYALSAPVGLKPGATKEDLEHTMAGRVLEYAELVGTYARKAR
jgi:Raf kinase inhibitor-like YbhB/YbcL family protein